MSYNKDNILNTPLDYVLGLMGYRPVFKKNNGLDLWYHSPFREEKTASFHVNLTKNKWFDFGGYNPRLAHKGVMGDGGDIINFVQEHEGLNFQDSIKYLNGILKGSIITNRIEPRKPINYSTEPAFIIDQVIDIYSYPLKNLLSTRKISLQVAQNYLKEIRYHHTKTGSKYYGLGMLNIENGYEIKQQEFKTSIGAKTIIFLKGKNSSTLDMFEGFMDFLTYQEHQKNRSVQPVNDTLILCSTSLRGVASLFLSQTPNTLDNYKSIHTYFDNDVGGSEARTYFKELYGSRLHEMNYIYGQHNDLNEWACRTWK